MARSRLCRVCKEFHDTEQVWPQACADHFGAVANGAPYVISDNMSPIRSMADGRMYDSKSRYRAELGARGCREVGNDSLAARKTALPPVRDTIRQVIQQLS